jgi:hypothetical protein
MVMPNDNHTAEIGYTGLTGLSMSATTSRSFTEQRGAFRSISVLPATAAASTSSLVIGEPFLVPGFSLVIG